MTTNLDRVAALAEPALLLLAAGHFDQVAPQLRAAIAACTPQQRLEIDLPPGVLQALLVPVLERLSPDEVREHLGPLEELDGHRLAKFWGAIAAGEVGLDD